MLLYEVVTSFITSFEWYVSDCMHDRYSFIYHFDEVDENCIVIADSLEWILWVYAYQIRKAAVKIIAPTYYKYILWFYITLSLEMLHNIFLNVFF